MDGGGYISVCILLVLIFKTKIFNNIQINNDGIKLYFWTYLRDSNTIHRWFLWKKWRCNRRQWNLSSGSASFSFRRNSSSFKPVLCLYISRDGEMIHYFIIWIFLIFNTSIFILIIWYEWTKHIALKINFYS